MESKDVREILKPLIERGRKEIFSPLYQAEQSDEKILGIIIAKYFQWDGVAILETAKAGLEDANFHEDAEALESRIKFYAEPESEELK